jgi:hypothetical protein
VFVPVTVSELALIWKLCPLLPFREGAWLCRVPTARRLRALAGFRGRLSAPEGRTPCNTVKERRPGMTLGCTARGMPPRTRAATGTALPGIAPRSETAHSAIVLGDVNVRIVSVLRSSWRALYASPLAVLEKKASYDLPLRARTPSE